ncbi:Vps51/Vps67-domain-containing protein [Syncephalastrum racemosum]|uniref:Vacuolar protein sorting-associated protein 51 homolog n=1 Tax=Syncephalastrum racemosum TaxID=13706 RepID=A0A1X2HTR3_SYNRA|nr:Vps51/Vps67-domain-containing protein [Syncephalastrum racemosum]
MDKNVTTGKKPPRDRNSLLKKYYGIGNVAQNQTPAHQPFDIDAESFEPSRYFARLLKEKTLSGLVARDNELVSEIRGIDGDMKTLVYENYSKFISATDTIHKMKSNVESMESEMSLLTDNINNITDHCTTLNTALGPNRDKIRRLTNVHNLLKRLQFIFDLPNRLNQCLATGNYHQAVKFYSRASRLLDHYQHMSAFKGIERDCLAITDKMKSEIRKRMADTDESLDALADNTRLLLLLKEDPRLLWKDYIKIQVKHLEKVMAQEPSDLVVDWLAPLEETTNNFQHVFLVNQQESDHILALKDAEEAKQDLLRGIAPFIDRLFDRIQSTVQLPDTLDTTLPHAEMETLNTLCEAFAGEAQALSSLADANERMRHVITTWEETLAVRFMGSVKVQLKDRVTKIQAYRLDTTENIAANREALNEFLENLQTWLIDYIQKQCLEPLQNCMEAPFASATREDFIRLVQLHLKTTWRDILDIIASEPTHDTSLVVGSRLCYDLADNGIVQVYQSVEGCEEDLQHVVEDYLRKGQALLNEQTLYDGFTLSSMIQQHYLNRPSGHEVTRVSPVWKDVLLRLQYADQLVQAIFSQASADGQTEVSETDYDYRFGSGDANASGLYTRPTQSTHSLVTTASQTNERQDSAAGLGLIPKLGYDGTLLNIDKLFEDRVDIYRPAEPSPRGVCSGLVRILVKALHETVRLMQVRKQDYQQLQIDTEFLRTGLWAYTQSTDSKWVSSMLQEIISSAHSRCTTPTPLSQEELDQIIRSS